VTSLLERLGAAELVRELTSLIRTE